MRVCFVRVVEIVERLLLGKVCEGCVNGRGGKVVRLLVGKVRIFLGLIN